MLTRSVHVAQKAQQMGGGLPGAETAGGSGT